MYRELSVLMLTVAIAGCDGGDAPPPGPPASTAQVRVGFGGLVDTIDVAAIERLPLRAAELVAPDGTATPSGPITVESSPRFATGQWNASNPWKDSVTGNNALAALTLRQPQAGAALQGQEQLLAMVSDAQISLPDPVAYRREWGNYRIRLTFGTPPGEVETQEIPAPAPPPR
jgi:hypothetical protein